MLLHFPGQGGNGRFSGTCSRWQPVLASPEMRSIDKAGTPSYVCGTSPAMSLCVGSALKSAAFHGAQGERAGTRAATGRAPRGQDCVADATVGSTRPADRRGQRADAADEGPKARAP